MKRILSLVLLFSLVATAQPQAEYTFQKDDSVLKRTYYSQALKKHLDRMASLGKENAGDYKKIYDDQFKAISELFQTSRSVTSPEAHQYLQSILQSIILANSELKGLDLRVVFSRDWWPNAYSLGDGTIMINAGLMVYLDDEAQLAFILCHELAHYYLDHTGKSIKRYIETINSDQFKQELKRISKQQYKVNQELRKLEKNVVFDSRLHSRDNEAEADRQAFLFMKHAGYDCNAIKSTLELLDRIDDSFLYSKLNLEQLFNFPGYPFKKKWIEEESTIFSKMEEKGGSDSQQVEDSLKTHPDCKKRILLLNDSLAAISSPGREFMISEPLFKKLKKDFFLEINEECYNESNLSRNLYYSLLLVQANEHLPLAVYSVARCLNQIYKNQKKHVLGKTIETESRQSPDDYNLLLRMLSRLRLEEITSLNHYFCDRYFQQVKDYEGFIQEYKIMQDQKD